MVGLHGLRNPFRFRLIPRADRFAFRLIPRADHSAFRFIPHADYSIFFFRPTPHATHFAFGSFRVLIILRPPSKPFCRRIISQRPSDRCTTKTKNSPENRRNPPFSRAVAQPRLLRLQNDPPPSSNPAAPKHETAEKHSGTSTKSGRLIFCCRKPRHQSKKVAELCAARASAMQK